MPPLSTAAPRLLSLAELGSAQTKPIPRGEMGDPVIGLAEETECRRSHAGMAAEPGLHMLYECSVAS